MKLIGLVLVALAIACHSDSYQVPFYGANGPLIDGAEERLTYTDTNEDGVKYQAFRPNWAADGQGIIFSFLPREYAPGEKKLGQRCVLSHDCRVVAQDPGDKCLSLLPPTGGSAYWNICEARSGHSNVVDRIEAGDVNAAGQVLYTEESGPASQQFVPDGPPAVYGDLWLSTVRPPVVRRDLCRFYSDKVVLPPAPPCTTGLLQDIHWSGANSFVALSGARLIRGTITADGVSMAAVATPTAVTGYSLAGDRSAAIFVGGDATVRRVTIADGTVAAVGTIPILRGAQLLDVGCHPDLCIVLATSGGIPAHWDLWRLDLATGNSAIVRTFDHELITAKLSPISGDVLAMERIGLDSGIFLITKVIP